MHVVGHPLIEALLTPLTLVLLCIPMDLEMTAEVALVIEMFPTDGTGTGELARSVVPRTVIAVVSELTKLLPTVGTLELLLPSRSGPWTMVLIQGPSWQTPTHSSPQM